MIVKLFRTIGVLAVGLAFVLTGCNSDGAADSNDDPSAGGTPPTEDTAAVEDEPGSAEDPTDAGNEPSENDGDTSESALVAADDLTKPGTTLDTGEPATVLMSTSKEESTVEVTVSEPRAGDPADLAEHNVPDEFEGYVPYYLDVSVMNVGEGNLGNGSVRVRGLTSGGQRIIAAVVTGLDKCDSTSFPSDVVNGDSIDTCFLFMLPEGDTLMGAELVDFDREQGDDPIIWEF